jgi:hypothetical protein
LFFVIDRIEGQATRVKVEKLQTHYCELERLHIAKNRTNDQIHFAKLLLLLSKLRALDALSKLETGRKQYSRKWRYFYFI